MPRLERIIVSRLAQDVSDICRMSEEAAPTWATTWFAQVFLELIQSAALNDPNEYDLSSPIIVIPKKTYPTYYLS